ncbi:MAG: hypothetical protein SFX19_10325 [Alphaproteobacteria bacterium]|nr:hypothetical protein [Alphaproteobacteria bacterium]
MSDAKIASGIDAAKIGAGAVSNTEFGYLDGVTSALQTQLDAKQAAGNYITALTGDATASGPGSAALTLATVNGNTGSFGSSTAIPSFTVNAKGLITAAGTNAVVAPAGTLTGTSLASNVVSSSLTSVGTLGALTVTGNITNSALTASQITATDGSKNLVSLSTATYPSLTELSYVKGATSSIQTQLAAKADYSFKTIAISGQSDVVADSSTDTLTLVAGSNITLTTNASTDTITIAASGGGGGGGGYETIQEEGSGLTQRDTINFVGAGITAADDAGNSRTNVTLDATLNGIAALTTAADQMIVSTGVDTFATETFKKNTTGAAVTYTDTASIAWTGTTAPSGTLTAQYSYETIGNYTFLTLTLAYSVAGSALTRVTFDIPSGLPTPLAMSGQGASNRIYTVGSGGMAPGLTSTIANNSKVYLSRNASNANKIAVEGASGTHQVVFVSLAYPS